MLLTDFDFPFDATLIADRPVQPRHDARLLVMARGGRACQHRRVSDLPSLLEPGDVLVVNNTKVAAARLSGRKRPGGGRVEMVLVRDLGGDVWEALLKGHTKPGQVIDLGSDATATIVQQNASSTTVKLTSAASIATLLKDIGQMPLPPYIKRAPTAEDRTWYQTIFATVEGAIAAPTASLHFTDDLVAQLRQRGITVVTITLHVGPATFQPVRVTTIEAHRMGAEEIEISEETAEAVTRAKKERRRVVAIGTTVARALESAASPDGTVRSMAGQTTLFIVPGYRFRIVDAMMTNFHLPRTTLLMLVSAFVGLDSLRDAYQLAVKEGYRFYSYGDAMLIL